MTRNRKKESHEKRRRREAHRLGVTEAELIERGHESALRTTIARCLSRAADLEHAIEAASSRINPKKIDMARAILESLVDISRALAFLMDERLAELGRDREVQIIPKTQDGDEEAEKGNGRDGPPMIVVGR